MFVFRPIAPLSVDLLAQAALDARLVEQAQHEEQLRCGAWPGCTLVSLAADARLAFVGATRALQPPPRPVCPLSVCRLARRRLSGLRASTGGAELAQKQGLASELQGRLRAGGMSDAALAQLVQAGPAQSTAAGGGDAQARPDAGALQGQAAVRERGSSQRHASLAPSTNATSVEPDHTLLPSHRPAASWRKSALQLAAALGFPHRRMMALVLVVTLFDYLLVENESARAVVKQNSENARLPAGGSSRSCKRPRCGRGKQAMRPGMAVSKFGGRDNAGGQECWAGDCEVWTQ